MRRRATPRGRATRLPRFPRPPTEQAERRAGDRAQDELAGDHAAAQRGPVRAVHVDRGEPADVDPRPSRHEGYVRRVAFDEVTGLTGDGQAGRFRVAVSGPADHRAHGFDTSPWRPRLARRRQQPPGDGAPVTLQLDSRDVGPALMTLGIWINRVRPRLESEAIQWPGVERGPPVAESRSRPQALWPTSAAFTVAISRTTGSPKVDQMTVGRVIGR